MNLNLGDTELIIAEAKKQGLLRNQLAYVLATAYHETAHTMKPITELGGQSYLKSKKYYPYIGRGYVQLTWETNYKRAGDKLGVDFVSNPSLLLQSQYSIPVLIYGMKEGWFTSKKLSDYIDLHTSNYEQARRIVNSLDKNILIAGYAKTYDTLLTDIGYGLDASSVPVQPVPDVPSVIVPETPKPSVQPPVASTGPTGILGVVLMLLNLIFGKKS